MGGRLFFGVASIENFAIIEKAYFYSLLLGFERIYRLRSLYEGKILTNFRIYIEIIYFINS